MTPARARRAPHGGRPDLSGSHPASTEPDDREIEEGTHVRIDPHPRNTGTGDDDAPGQPWQPPQEPPSPDGSSPEGDGKHRK